MLKLFALLPHRLIAIAAVAALMVGLVTTRVVISVATITIACNALLHPEAAKHFRMWLKNRPAMLFAGLFIIYLLSGLYSNNTQAWWNNTQDKLPLLAIPFGWTVIEKDLKGWTRAFLFVFVAVMSLSALAVLGNYLTHFDTLNNSIKMGHAIPTPMNDHIRFSLEIAFAALISLFLLTDEKRRYPAYWKWLLLAALLILIVTLHFLAVRSGILALYTGVFLFIIHTIIRRKRWKSGILLLTGALLFFILALQLIPSLHNKLLYFKYEWELISQGELKEGHSDAQRVQSTLYGWDVALEHFPLGSGTGDLRTIMNEQYASNEKTAQVKPELPHNQFVYTLAATGLAGLIMLLSAFFHPGIKKTSWRSWIMPAFLFILFLSFMTEHVLEIQIGISFVMLFSVLLPAVLKESA